MTVRSVAARLRACSIQSCLNQARRDTERAISHKRAQVCEQVTQEGTSLIVFGKDVAAEDIVGVNDKIVHGQTGDSITISITIKGDCFNTVFDMTPADSAYTFTQHKQGDTRWK